MKGGLGAGNVAFKIGGMKIPRQNYAIFGRGRAAAEHNTHHLMRTVRNIDLFLSQWKLNRGFWSVFLYHCDGIWEFCGTGVIA